MSDDLNYIFSQQGIQELKERLGIMPEENTNESADPDAEYLSDEISVSVIEDISEIEIVEQVESGGVSFPFPITVSEPVSRIAPDGSTVFDIVVSFDDVSGVNDYEVRYVAKN